jgi:hypothetical protein
MVVPSAPQVQPMLAAAPLSGDRGWRVGWSIVGGIEVADFPQEEHAAGELLNNKQMLTGVEPIYVAGSLGFSPDGLFALLMQQQVFNAPIQLRALNLDFDRRSSALAQLKTAAELVREACRIAKVQTGGNQLNNAEKLSWFGSQEAPQADVLKRISGFVQNLAAGPVLQPKAIIIPPLRCAPAGSSGVDVQKDKCYLTLAINELFLSNARKWFVDYQPMVVFATTFVHGNATVTVPAVVGPSLLARPGQQLPQGLLLNDIEVAGPIPYRGGTLTISLLLYRLRHTNHARDLLQLVEGVSKAIGPTADLSMLLKVGGTLLDGLGSLLGLADTEAVMGQRFTLSPVGPGGMKTFYAALIGTGGGSVLPDDLSVDQGRLRSSNGSNVAQFTSADYVLYSLSAPVRRTDESTLPCLSLISASETRCVPRRRGQLENGEGYVLRRLAANDGVPRLDP